MGGEHLTDDEFEAHDCGYVFGREGCSLLGGVSRIGTLLGRSLTAWERREFAAGWRLGELARLNADSTLTACELLTADLPL